MIKSNENRRKFSNAFRAKNSVDSLSEDSGYCDRDIRSLQGGTLSLDSSMPTGNDLEDEECNVIEEKSILNQMRNLSLKPRVRSHSDEDDVCYHSMESLNRKCKSRKIDLLNEINIESFTSIANKPSSTTINTTQVVPASKMYSTSAAAVAAAASSTHHKPHELKIDLTNVDEHMTMVKNKKENSHFEIKRERFISISSPELYASVGYNDNNDGNSKKFSRLKLKRNYNQRLQSKDFYSVSSVPDHLNLLSINCNDNSCGSDDNSYWSDVNACDSIASKNFNLFDLNYGRNHNNINASNNSSSASRNKVIDISASCANLTLLNYSDDDQVIDFKSFDNNLNKVNNNKRLNSRNHTKTSTKAIKMSGKMPTNMYHPSADDSDDDDDDYISTYRSKELTSLLEEISAHFNKNLSILNDREASYESPETEIKPINKSEVKLMPPKPPPRRTQIKTSPNHSPPKKSTTFDRDPTNLTTTYTQSLEKCNFNIDEPVNVYSSRQNIYLPDNNNKKSSDDDGEQKPVHKRNFVSSTPNLNYFDFEMRHVPHYSSIDNNATMSNDHLSPSMAKNDENRCTSMKEIPSSHSRASSTGILASHSTNGSRSGLSVSFCPIVSEISWQVSVEDDEFSDDIDMDPSAGDRSRNDSLVNYYNHNDNDDDDDEEDFDDFRAVGTSTITNTKALHDDHDETSTPTNIEHSQNTVDSAISEKHEAFTHTLTISPVSKASSTGVVEMKIIPSASSNKMLVETQTPSEKLIVAECQQQSAAKRDLDAKVQSQIMTTVPQNLTHVNSNNKSNTLNEKMSSKGNKNKKSIFSRLSSGFRFSFRGKKNKKSSLVGDGVVHYPLETNNNREQAQQQQMPQQSHIVDNKSRHQQAQAQQNSVKSNDVGDFIYIPLKAPNDNVKNFDLQNDKLAQDLQMKLQNNQLPSTQNQQQLTVDRQSRATKHQQQQQSRESPPKMNGNQVMGKPPLPKQPPRIVGTTTKRASAHAPRASSTPRDYDGEYYQENMVGDGLKQQYYSERARTMDGGSSSGHKIGLIETNLDTDETIINGKTQSLMELGIGIRNNHNSNNHGKIGGVQVMQNDENDSGNNNERWRPHKSMEFLLDKENHQRILVSYF
jgi:hypothetical protein